MSQLHFYSPESWYQRAVDPETGLRYTIVRDGPGCFAIVVRDRKIIHQIDWSDHRVHVDEMKRALQDWADSQREAHSAATVEV